MRCRCVTLRQLLRDGRHGNLYKTFYMWLLALHGASSCGDSMLPPRADRLPERRLRQSPPATRLASGQSRLQRPRWYQPPRPRLPPRAMQRPLRGVPAGRSGDDEAGDGDEEAGRPRASEATATRIAPTVVGRIAFRALSGDALGDAVGDAVGIGRGDALAPRYACRCALNRSDYGPGLGALTERWVRPVPPRVRDER